MVFIFEFLGASHTGCAEVDADNLSFRPTHCIFCSLRGPAAGYQNGEILTISAVRPEQMIIRAAFLLVLPAQSIVIKAIDWLRIRILFVELPNVRRRLKR